MSVRFLTAIDELAREAPWIGCARHLDSVEIVLALEQLVGLRGCPAVIKSNNVPGFVSHRVQEWIKERGIGAKFIAPGRPWQNGHNECFNGVFRDGCLNRSIFESLREARKAPESWLYEYGVERLDAQDRSLTQRLFPELRPATWFNLELGSMSVTSGARFAVLQ